MVVPFEILITEPYLGFAPVPSYLTYKSWNFYFTIKNMEVVIEPY